MAEVKEKHDVMIRATVNPTMGERISQYNSSIRELVEKYYPTKTKQIKVVPHAPWFDSEYKNLRALRRKAEKSSKKPKNAKNQGEPSSIVDVVYIYMATITIIMYSNQVVQGEYS